MATFNIVCDGPGPHVPASGIIGTADRQISGMRCSAAVCQPVQDPSVANGIAIRSKALQALTANATFLALATPTAAQQLAQVQAITKECNALIRLVLGQLDTTTGT